MFVIPNSEDPGLAPEEESAFEAVISAISAELAESVIARGVRSIDFLTYTNDAGEHVVFEFRPAGTPQVPIDEFERVLAMRFVQILWEQHGKRCLPVGLAKGDRKFVPWPEGRPDYILAKRMADGEDVEPLPPGLR